MVLRELTALGGVSGNEGRVRDYIMKKARLLADEVKVDKLGNVLAFKRGNKPGGKHVMMCAHMDEVGLIVKGVNDEGLIVYETVGGIDPRVMVSKRVVVGEEELPGVIGAKAIHLQTPEDRKSPLSHKQLFVDIGAKDKESAQARVKVGDFISFEPSWVEFGKDLVMAKALDDRVGCWNLLRLMEDNYPCDVTYAFNVQEEVGLRGARVAAWQVRPDCALVLEGTTANDLGKIPDHLKVCRVGGGVAISFMDNTSIAHPGLNRALGELAQAQGISWQIKTFVSGGNDAGAIQTARGAVAVCPLSVPCRYIHSPSSVCSLKDADAQRDLARAFLAAGAAFEQA